MNIKFAEKIISKAKNETPKLCFPEFTNKQLSGFAIVYNNDEIVIHDNYEIQEIDDKGYVYLSDLSKGIIQYNHKNNKYELAYYGYATSLSIKGFVVCLEDE